MSSKETAATQLRDTASRGAPVPAAGRWRWVTAAAVGAAVGAVVVAVYAAAGGDGANGASPDSGASVVEAGSGSGLASASVDLFDAQDGDEPDTVTTATADVDGTWPVSGCAAPAGTDPGRTDFLSGTEHGPEYSRDAAVGWYVDATAAQTAYEAVVARVAACAADTGATLSTQPAALGETGSVSVVTSAAAAADEAAGGDDAAAVGSEAVGSGETASDPRAVSLTAMARSGSVVVFATGRATFYGAPPAESSAAAVTQAERLLAEACRVAPDRC